MMVIKSLLNISNSLNQKVSIFPLVTFRVIFGGLMLFSTLRFWLYGWIEDFYLTPTHFFPYFGLNWIQPYNEILIYSLFILMVISSIGILLGVFYRVSSVLFFLAFTYVELIDKTTYLNHYYFISIMAFLMIWMPAHKAISIDAKLFPKIKSLEIPKWCSLTLKAQIFIVYFFAGVAKLNFTWLIEAQPMSLWLDSKSHYPILGSLFSEEITPFIFSWAGMLFDLLIGFMLFSKKLRPIGYAAVIVFHVLTWWLFPIGVFPWIMIGLTLVFFSENWHERGWKVVIRNSKFDIRNSQLEVQWYRNKTNRLQTSNLSAKRHGLKLINSLTLSILSIHFILQTIIPLRHLAYDSNLYWAESGYRFSWRVMLMEKTGHVEFKVKDIATQKESIISNSDYFSPFQQRQLATQPDMIRQAAEIIASDFKSKGKNIEIFALSFASLNGEKHKPLVKPNVNLAALKNVGLNSWIMPHED